MHKHSVSAVKSAYLWIGLALLALLVMAPAVAAAAAAPSLEGTWQGTLDAGMQGKLRVVAHLAATKDGGWTGTLDSPDQGASGIPIESITFKDSNLRLDVKAIGGLYEGKANKELSEIAGTWSQNGATLDLTFTRQETKDEKKK